MKTVRTKDRGSALLETALVMPLLLMLTLGGWSLARAWQVHNTMDHAVREGARYGATIDPWVTGLTDGSTPGSSAAAIRAVINAELGAGSIPTASVATLCIDKGPSACTSQAGIVAAPSGSENVAIRIRFNNYSMNFVLFTKTVNLTASAVGRWEQ